VLDGPILRPGSIVGGRDAGAFKPGEPMFMALPGALPPPGALWE